MTRRSRRELERAIEKMDVAEFKGDAATAWVQQYITQPEVPDEPTFEVVLTDDGVDSDPTANEVCVYRDGSVTADFVEHEVYCERDVIPDFIDIADDLPVEDEVK